jgi:hypothetical protein
MTHQSSLYQERQLNLGRVLCFIGHRGQGLLISLFVSASYDGEKELWDWD